MPQNGLSVPPKKFCIILTNLLALGFVAPVLQKRTMLHRRALPGTKIFRHYDSINFLGALIGYNFFFFTCSKGCKLSDFLSSYQSGLKWENKLFLQKNLCVYYCEEQAI